MTGKMMSGKALQDQFSALKEGNIMDEETTKTTAELTLSFTLRDMDEETIEILVEDMIATGG